MPGEFLVTDAAGDGMWRWGREQGELKKPAALSAGRNPDLAGAPVLMWPLGLIVLSLLGIGVTLVARAV